MKSNIKSIVESNEDKQGKIELTQLKNSEPKPTWNEISGVIQNKNISLAV